MPQNSQYRKAEEIVAKIKRILGDFPGYRALHADGRLYKGIFRANDEARNYTRAIHLQGAEVPVTVRFSKGGGDPYAHFGTTVGMATRFYLDNGRVTNLIMLSQKLFIANSIDQFVGLLDAGLPAKPGGGPNLEGLKAFLAKNPNSAKVFQMRAEAPAPVSLAHTEFNSVHCFRYINAKHRETLARCHWAPVAGIKGQPVADLAKQSSDVLYTELEDRLAREPILFDLVLELAEPGDPIDDATALWPQDRRRVVIGRMSLTAPASETDSHDPVMNHDPTVLTDGIEATDDPILQIRRGVYEVSAASRSGGWRGGCPFGGGAKP